MLHWFVFYYSKGEKSWCFGPYFRAQLILKGLKVISKAIQVSNESSAKGGESAWARYNNKPSPFWPTNHGWLSVADK